MLHTAVVGSWGIQVGCTTGGFVASSGLAVSVAIVGHTVSATSPSVGSVTIGAGRVGLASASPLVGGTSGSPTTGFSVVEPSTGSVTTGTVTVGIITTGGAGVVGLTGSTGPIGVEGKKGIVGFTMGLITSVCVDCEL